MNFLMCCPAPEEEPCSDASRSQTPPQCWLYSQGEHGRAERGTVRWGLLIGSSPVSFPTPTARLHQTSRKPLGCQIAAVKQDRRQRERRLKKTTLDTSTRVSSSSESQQLGLVSSSAEGDNILATNQPEKSGTAVLCHPELFSK